MVTFACAILAMLHLSDNLVTAPFFWLAMAAALSKYLSNWAQSEVLQQSDVDIFAKSTPRLRHHKTLFSHDLWLVCDDVCTDHYRS